MGYLEEFTELEKKIQDAFVELRTKYEKVVKENEQLRSQISDIKGDLDIASEFAIEVGKGVKEETKTRTAVNRSYNIPSASISSGSDEKSVKPSDKFSTPDLEELLDTDPLSQSVYNKLKPLGMVKQRVLAMQMGISEARCQTAIDRLSSAGGVKVEADGNVSVL